MSNEDVERIVSALYRKAALSPRSGFTWEQWLHGIVATVVADTLLIADGSLSVEDFE